MIQKESIKEIEVFKVLNYFQVKWLKRLIDLNQLVLYFCEGNTHTYLLCIFLF